MPFYLQDATCLLGAGFMTELIHFTLIAHLWSKGSGAPKMEGQIHSTGNGGGNLPIVSCRG